MANNIPLPGEGWTQASELGMLQGKYNLSIDPIRLAQDNLARQLDNERLQEAIAASEQLRQMNAIDLETREEKNIADLRAQQIKNREGEQLNAIREKYGMSEAEVNLETARSVSAINQANASAKLAEMEYEKKQGYPSIQADIEKKKAEALAKRREAELAGIKATTDIIGAIGKAMPKTGKAGSDKAVPGSGTIMPTDEEILAGASIEGDDIQADGQLGAPVGGVVDPMTQRLQKLQADLLEKASKSEALFSTIDLENKHEQANRQVSDFEHDNRLINVVGNNNKRIQESIVRRTDDVSKPEYRISIPSLLTVSEAYNVAKTPEAKQKIASSLDASIEALGGRDALLKEVESIQDPEEKRNSKKALYKALANSGNAKNLAMEQRELVDSGIPVNNAEDPESTYDSMVTMLEGGTDKVTDTNLKDSINLNPYMGYMTEASDQGTKPFRRLPGTYISPSNGDGSDVSGQQSVPSIVFQKADGTKVYAPVPQSPQDKAFLNVIDRVSSTLNTKLEAKNMATQNAETAQQASQEEQRIRAERVQQAQQQIQQAPQQSSPTQPTTNVPDVVQPMSQAQQMQQVPAQGQQQQQQPQAATTPTQGQPSKPLSRRAQEFANPQETDFEVMTEAVDNVAKNDFMPKKMASGLIVKRVDDRVFRTYDPKTKRYATYNAENDISIPDGEYDPTTKASNQVIRTERATGTQIKQPDSVLKQDKDEINATWKGTNEYLNALGGVIDSGTITVDRGEELLAQIEQSGTKMGRAGFWQGIKSYVAGKGLGVETEKEIQDNLIEALGITSVIEQLKAGGIKSGAQISSIQELEAYMKALVSPNTSKEAFSYNLAKMKEAVLRTKEALDIGIELGSKKMPLSEPKVKSIMRNYSLRPETRSVTYNINQAVSDRINKQPIGDYYNRPDGFITGKEYLFGRKQNAGQAVEQPIDMQEAGQTEAVSRPLSGSEETTPTTPQDMPHTPPESPPQDETSMLDTASDAVSAVASGAKQMAKNFYNDPSGFIKGLFTEAELPKRSDEKEQRTIDQLVKASDKIEGFSGFVNALGYHTMPKVAVEWVDALATSADYLEDTPLEGADKAKAEEIRKNVHRTLMNQYGMESPFANTLAKTISFLGGYKVLGMVAKGVPMAGGKLLDTIAENVPQTKKLIELTKKYPEVLTSLKSTVEKIPYGKKITEIGGRIAPTIAGVAGETAKDVVIGATTEKSDAPMYEKITSNIESSLVGQGISGALGKTLGAANYGLQTSGLWQKPETNLAKMFEMADVPAETGGKILQEIAEAVKRGENPLMVIDPESSVGSVLRNKVLSRPEGRAAYEKYKEALIKEAQDVVTQADQPLTKTIGSREETQAKLTDTLRSEIAVAGKSAKDDLEVDLKANQNEATKQMKKITHELVSNSSLKEVENIDARLREIVLGEDVAKSTKLEVININELKDAVKRAEGQPLKQAKVLEQMSRAVDKSKSKAYKTLETVTLPEEVNADAFIEGMSEKYQNVFNSIHNQVETKQAGTQGAKWAKIKVKEEMPEQIIPAKIKPAKPEKVIKPAVPEQIIPAKTRTLKDGTVKVTTPEKIIPAQPAKIKPAVPEEILEPEKIIPAQPAEYIDRQVANTSSVKYLLDLREEIKKAEGVGTVQRDNMVKDIDKFLAKNVGKQHRQTVDLYTGTIQTMERLDERAKVIRNLAAAQMAHRKGEAMGTPNLYAQLFGTGDKLKKAESLFSKSELANYMETAEAYDKAQATANEITSKLKDPKLIAKELPKNIKLANKMLGDGSSYIGQAILKAPKQNIDALTQTLRDPASKQLVADSAVQAMEQNLKKAYSTGTPKNIMDAMGIDEIAYKNMATLVGEDTMKNLENLNTALSKNKRFNDYMKATAKASEQESITPGELTGIIRTSLHYAGTASMLLLVALTRSTLPGVKGQSVAEALLSGDYKKSSTFIEDALKGMSENEAGKLYVDYSLTPETKKKMKRTLYAIYKGGSTTGEQIDKERSRVKFD